MIIMGIDPGLAHAGWAIIETRQSVCRARAYGCIVTKSDEALASRLGKIYRETSEVISRYQPRELAIEKIFFGQNTASAIATAHSRGASLAAAATLGVHVGEYTPLEIKKAVVGTGSADKHQVTYMVRQILCLDHDPRPDHAADALAAALCHAHRLRISCIRSDI